MVKVDIFSGFLGAGKTTVIKKLLEEAYGNEKIVLIENEFGEIGVDGAFFKDTKVQVNELNSGCICCTLVGDFKKALNEVIEQYKPERIIIEPSGVGKLSDVTAAVFGASEEIVLNSKTTVVNAKKCKMYMKNFGEFFNNQIENADSIILTHAEELSKEKMDESIALIRSLNGDAPIIATALAEITGMQILDVIENGTNLEAEIEKMKHEHHHDHEHHHHDDDDEECCCGHHHDHEHHHHDDDDEECCCGHHHDHEHHHHDHEGHHHADEVFSDCGFETTKIFSKDELDAALDILMSGECGEILRAKGVVPCVCGKAWLHFDYIPETKDIRQGSANTIGIICVIGVNLDEAKIKKAFGL